MTAEPDRGLWLIEYDCSKSTNKDHSSDFFSWFTIQVLLNNKSGNMKKSDVVKMRDASLEMLSNRRLEE